MHNNSAFNLENNAAYEAWKTEKLDDYPKKAEQLIVEIDNPRHLSSAEKQAISQRCKKTNMAVYVSATGDDPDKHIPSELADQFGLQRLDKNMGADDDGITALQVQQDPLHKRYIPYTSHAIHWHTDGYYNSQHHQIMALLLHCVRPALEGGENALMDHEIAYIKLRDSNPEHIEALMQADVMTIPENLLEGRVIRPARSGPVFSITHAGQLHMRYTARARNVIWKQDAATQKAVTALEALLDSQSSYIYRLVLQPGWGLISNNVLHDRSAFSDDKSHTRLLYRLRYYDALDYS